MNWEQKYDALASMIEGYRHERNEALERLRLLEAEVERVNAREDATRRELYATCIDMRDAQRERDEARASAADAYRRGAEAMRMACIGMACAQDLDPDAQDRMEARLLALPIPEEP
jgi:chromosome segregation ATPase